MKLVPFGSICKLQNGRAFKPSDWSEKGDPIVRIQNLNNESKPFNYCNFSVEERFHINTGDLLFSWSGTPGTSFGAFFWNRGFGVLNQHIFRVDVDKNKISKDYLRYAINSQLNYIIDQAHGGVGLKHITKGKLEAVEIPLPPLVEQKRIGTILDKADAIRRKRQQAINLADEFLRSVFLDMFGDPTTNPKGWEATTLGDLIEFTKDGPHVSPKYSESGIPFLSTRHVKPTGVVWEDLKYVSQEEADLHWKKCKPQKGDILYTKGGTTGVACPVSFEKEFAVWVHVALVRPKAKLVNYIWLTHMLNSKYCYQQSQQLTRGATNKDLGLKRMVDIKMFAPPIEDQVKFVNLRDKVLELLSKFDDSGDYKFFESLSQKAFAGEL
jgi:type I restriction enzyme S subunit